MSLASVIYSRRNEEFIVATSYCLGRADMRTVSSETGAITKIYAELSGVDAEISFVGLVDKERRLLIALDSGDFAIAVTDNGKIIKRFKGHESQVIGMRFDPNSSRVVSAAIDGCVRVWDSAAMDTPVKELTEAHEGNLMHISVSFCQALLCTADDHGVVTIWSLDTFKVIGEANCGVSLVDLQLFDASPLLVICDIRGIVSLWAVGALMNQAIFAFDAGADNRTSDEIKCICLVENSFTVYITEPEQTFVFLGTDNGNLRCYNLKIPAAKVQPAKNKNKRDTFNRLVRVNGAELRAKLYPTQPTQILDSLHLNPKIRSVRAHYAKVTSLESDIVAGHFLVLSLAADLHFKIWSIDLELICSINITNQQADVWKLQSNSYARRAQLYSNAKALLTKIKRVFPTNLYANAYRSNARKATKYSKPKMATTYANSRIQKVLSLREIAAVKQTSLQMEKMTTSLPNLYLKTSSSFFFNKSGSFIRSSSNFNSELDAIDETSKLNATDTSIGRLREAERKSTISRLFAN